MGMDEDILKDFLAESRENIERLDQEFVELEEDPANEDLIKSIFRTIHTIKGTAGFFGFTTLEGIAHFAEDILSKLRDRVIGVNEEITTMLLRSVDHIKAILATLDSTRKEPDDIAYLDFIVDLRNFAERIVKGGTEATATAQAPADPVPQDPPPAPPPADAAPPVAPDALDGAANAKTSLEKDFPTAPAPVEAGPPRPVKPAQDAPATAHQLAETHVRVDVQLLDRLMNLAGELVLSRNRLAQIASQLNDAELMTANQRTSLIVTELQGEIMKTRMQAVGNVFNKFPRIVRDLAKAAQKQVQLRIEGAETELDRSIIEIIKDPLTHMVRNSIDHGIEAPDIRVQKDKPPSGTLVMRAYHEGGQVIIEIQDDGAGIDPARIRAKALEKGVITASQAASISDRDALMLIFQPGFSTAEKVTNISGRGVGMDVVRTNIEKIGGAVELASEPGHGATVKVKIPLTLAIIPALIVHSGGQRYAIPQVNLVELVHLTQETMARDIQTIGNSEFYRLRGEILPLVHLDAVLGNPGGNGDRKGVSIVVLSTGDRQFGLAVDGISDSEEIVVKPLGRHLKGIPCYAGTTLMGDGRVALILDVVGIASTLNLKMEERLRESRRETEGEMSADSDRQFLLLFSVDPSEVFAIPLALVHRLDKISASKIENVGGREVIQYRGDSMPVVRIENFLPVRPLPDQEEYHLIVFNMNGRDISFLVGKIEDSLNLAVDVDDRVYKQEGILGSAIVKDRTTLFLDVYQLISLYEPKFFANQHIQETSRARLLLAEDSTFYRNLLTSYLEAAGYDVVAAGDGLDAWQRLQEGGFDMLITDIEMPRMNGFELTERIRNSNQFRDLPILAVTSLSGEEDRRRGQQAGVSAYQVKIERDTVIASVQELLKSYTLRKAA